MTSPPPPNPPAEVSSDDDASFELIDEAHSPGAAALEVESGVGEEQCEQSGLKPATAIQEDILENEENAELEKAKAKNREDFCAHYQRAVKWSAELDANQDWAFPLLFVDIMLSLVLVGQPIEKVSSACCAIFGLSMIIEVAAALLNLPGSLKEAKRYAAGLALIVLNAVYVAPSANRVYVFIAKLILVFYYLWELKNEALLRATRVKFQLEKVSGLDLHGTSAADAGNEATENSDDSDVSEPAIRTLTLSKARLDALGLIVSATEESIIVYSVLPRGLVEKQCLMSKGDQILSVNGIDLIGKKIDFAHSIVAGIEGEVRIEVQHNAKLADAKLYYL